MQTDSIVRIELEPVGLIGAVLTSKGKLCVVEGFAQDSAIKHAGLKKGPVIIGVDDIPVDSLVDYKIAVMDKQAGRRQDTPALSGRCESKSKGK